MTQRFEGKNLDEALTEAAQGLGVERFQLTYHVLLEKRGFLGGVKRVVIEADINAEATADAAPPPVAESRPSAPPSSRPARGAGGGGGRGPRGGGRGRGGDRDGNRDRGARAGGGRGAGGRGGGRGRREGGGEDLQVGDFERFAEDVVVEAPVQGEESEVATSVRAWCEKVIELARFDLEVRTEENETQVIVRLYGRDSKRLVEHHGELLDAIQVLANKSLTGRKIEKDIELDCQEFKGRRVEELAQRARELAERVRRDGREQLLPAMSPIERRIIHLTLQDDAEVSTESRGDGFYKRVAVIRRSDAAIPPES